VSPVAWQEGGAAGPKGPAGRLRLSRGTPDNARGCAAVMRAAIRALGRRPRAARDAAALAAWASLTPLYHRWAMGPGGESYLLAREGGRTLGYAARRGGELTAVFVRPRAQGRGVGRALVEALCAEVTREGRCSLRVLAARAALPFYAALGFTGRRAVAVPPPGGRTLAAVELRRRLAPSRGRRAPARTRPVRMTSHGSP
jgi:GNAT superfamily N-acetyltransferase